MRIKNTFSRTKVAVIMTLALIVLLRPLKPEQSSSMKLAFRIENFVRSLETSGVDGLSRIYQFRGRNMALTKRPAIQISGVFA